MIKEIREKIGLSQYSLAGYLGVSQSLIYYAEKNMRELPKEAFWRFHKLSQHFETTSKCTEKISLSEAREKIIQKKQDKLVRQATRKISEYNFKIMVLQRKLNQMKMIYQQTAVQLQLINALTADTSKEQTTRDCAWLAFQTAEANKRLSGNGITEQILLEAKINSLLALKGVEEVFVEKLSVASERNKIITSVQPLALVNNSKRRHRIPSA